MTDNARIDDGKLIELLTKAFEQARKLLFVSAVRNAAEAEAPLWLEAADAAIVAAADALARRSIQEQPEAVAASDVAKPMAASFFAAMLDADDDRTSPEEHPDMILVNEHEVLIAMMTAIIANRARLASAPPPVAGAGWKVVPVEPTDAMLATQGKSKPWNAKTEATRKLAEDMNTSMRQMAGNVYREMLAVSPVPDNTDARGAQVHAGTREVADELWCKLLPHMQVDSTEGYADKVAALDIIEAALAAPAIIPGTDASGVQKESKQLVLTPTDALSSEAAAREDAGPVASRRLVEALIEISLLRVDLSEATDPIALFAKLEVAVNTARRALDPVKAPKP